ncbi:MAG: MmgE/PrpD family protein [Pseudomonadota bacterium]
MKDFTDDAVSPSGALAHFAADFDLGRVPAETVERAKICLLDALGIGLASAGSDYGASLASALADLGGTGDFPVIGSRLTLSQRDSAHLNGTLIHGLDFDDTHTEDVVHTSASAAPTMLSAGLAAKADGARALAAFILATEVAARIGVSARGGFHENGFHPTGVCGAFGAAVASGYLLGLNAEQLVSAQGIVSSKASGLLEFLSDGAWTKRNHPGWASVAGQTAAAMAGRGFFGPQRPYDGRYGLFAAPMLRPIRPSIVRRRRRGPY